MLKPEQVPDEVVEAARRAYETHCGHELGAFTSAIAAAINAWPGFEYRADVAYPAFGYGPAAFILPLSQEAGDE